jgi:hypothetical protein
MQNLLPNSKSPKCTDYREEAWRRWPEAYWIYNNGPFAVISTCSAHVKITLHPTLARAKEVKDVIDRNGCSHEEWRPWKPCDGKHEIVNLRKPPKSDGER